VSVSGVRRRSEAEGCQVLCEASEADGAVGRRRSGVTVLSGHWFLLCVVWCAHTELAVDVPTLSFVSLFVCGCVCVVCYSAFSFVFAFVFESLFGSIVCLLCSGSVLCAAVAATVSVICCHFASAALPSTVRLPLWTVRRCG